MQPTPQTQDSSFNYYDEAAREAEADADLQTLLAVVAPQFHHLVNRALGSACRAAEVAQYNADQATWRQILAHVPGIAPALEILDAHVTGGAYACDGREPCPVKPLARPWEASHA